MAVTLEIPDFLEAQLRSEAAERRISFSDYLLIIIRERRRDDRAIALRLSLQGALVGAITPNLYAVTAGIVDNVIRINAFLDNNVTEDDLENISSIGAEVIADFPEVTSMEETCFSRRDMPVEPLEFWAFMREDEARKNL